MVIIPRASLSAPSRIGEDEGRGGEGRGGEGRGRGGGGEVTTHTGCDGDLLD